MCKDDVGVLVNDETNVEVKIPSYIHVSMVHKYPWKKPVWFDTYGYH
jgi:hypothetical protein